MTFFSDITNYIVDRKLHLGKLILAGDFNASCIDWDNFASYGRDKKLCDSLVNMALSFALTQIVTSATREN